MADFPAGKLRHNGFKRQLKADVLRTPMESGPPKQALLSSRSYQEFPVTYLFTQAEYLAFETWVRDTIQFVGEFNWVEPLSGATVVTRIVMGDASDATPINPHMEDWVVNMQFEVLV